MNKCKNCVCVSASSMRRLDHRPLAAEKKNKVEKWWGRTRKMHRAQKTLLWRRKRRRSQENPLVRIKIRRTSHYVSLALYRYLHNAFTAKMFLTSDVFITMHDLQRLQKRLQWICAAGFFSEWFKCTHTYICMDVILRKWGYSWKAFGAKHCVRLAGSTETE